MHRLPGAQKWLPFVEALIHARGGSPSPSVKLWFPIARRTEWEKDHGCDGRTNP
jgi:hypothetical protein